jgi:hypothetical protein
VRPRVRSPKISAELASADWCRDLASFVTFCLARFFVCHSGRGSMRESGATVPARSSFLSWYAVFRAVSARGRDSSILSYLIESRDWTCAFLAAHLLVHPVQPMRWVGQCHCCSHSTRCEAQPVGDARLVAPRSKRRSLDATVRCYREISC